jgi:hypothetical protein
MILCHILPWFLDALLVHKHPRAERSPSLGERPARFDHGILRRAGVQFIGEIRAQSELIPGWPGYRG